MGKNKKLHNEKVAKRNARFAAQSAARKIEEEKKDTVRNLHRFSAFIRSIESMLERMKTYDMDYLKGSEETIEKVAGHLSLCKEIVTEMEELISSGELFTLAKEAMEIKMLEFSKRQTDLMKEFVKLTNSVDKGKHEDSKEEIVKKPEVDETVLPMFEDIGKVTEVSSPEGRMTEELKSA